MQKSLNSERVGFAERTQQRCVTRSDMITWRFGDTVWTGHADWYFWHKRAAEDSFAVNGGFRLDPHTGEVFPA